MRKSKTPKLTPNANDPLQFEVVRRWQAQTARYLAAHGADGPFVVDSKLYLVHGQTGTLTYIATRMHNAQKDHYQWLNVETGLEIKDGMHNQVASSQSGEPVAGPFGSFAGFHLAPPAMSIPAARPHTSSISALESSPFRTGNDPMWFTGDGENSGMFDGSNF